MLTVERATQSQQLVLLVAPSVRRRMVIERHARHAMASAHPLPALPCLARRATLHLEMTGGVPPPGRTHCATNNATTLRAAMTTTTA
eukprot:COSAG02_NODE_142_length_34188_cov_183.180791_8_plen_87_part_00